MSTSLYLLATPDTRFPTCADPFPVPIPFSCRPVALREHARLAARQGAARFALTHTHTVPSSTSYPELAPLDQQRQWIDARPPFGVRLRQSGGVLRFFLALPGFQYARARRKRGRRRIADTVRYTQYTRRPTQEPPTRHIRDGAECIPAVLQ
jgi:hypothetical protein